MNSITEKHHDSGFLLSEANLNRSRENGVLAEGENLEAGAILGRLTSGGKLVQHDEDAMTGAETAIGILLNATDATDADTAVAYIARDAEVIADELAWKTTSPAVDRDAVRESLADVGIILRQSNFSTA